MKFIKSFKIFEDIHDHHIHDDSLKNTFTYLFSSPISVVQHYDENNQDLEQVFNYITDEQGHDIVEEMADELDMTKDEFLDDIDDNFDKYLNRRYGKSKVNMYDKFFDEYFGGETDIEDEEYKDLVDAFNEEDLKEYFDEEVDFKILKMEAQHSKSYTRMFDVKVETDKDLTPEDIKKVKDYLTGQYSDGFGEGYEQQIIKSKLEPLNGRGRRGRGYGSDNGINVYKTIHLYKSDSSRHGVSDTGKAYTKSGGWNITCKKI